MTRGRPNITDAPLLDLVRARGDAGATVTELTDQLPVGRRAVGIAVTRLVERGELERRLEAAVPTTGRGTQHRYYLAGRAP